MLLQGDLPWGDYPCSGGNKNGKKYEVSEQKRKRYYHQRR